MGEFRYVGEDALKARFLEALEPKIMEHADEVLTEIKTVATPVDTSALERSARTTDTRVNSASVTTKIVAGEGLPRPYGEITERKDAIHHAHGGAHFVAKSVLSSVPKLIERVAQAGREAY